MSAALLALLLVQVEGLRLRLSALSSAQSQQAALAARLLAELDSAQAQAALSSAELLACVDEMKKRLSPQAPFHQEQCPENSALTIAKDATTCYEI